MSTRIWKIGIAGAVTAAFLVCAVAMAQDKKPDGTKPDAPKPATPAKPDGAKPAPAKPADGAHGGGEMADAMKRWQDFATTGEAHKNLEHMVGTWNLEVKHSMPGAASPEVMNCTAEVQWILDKHFLEERVTGPGETPTSPPFEGRGLMGYDNLKKEYVSIFIHSMSTGFQMSHGPAGKDPNHFTFEAEASDPMAGKTVKLRCTVDVADKDKHIYTQYATGPDGKEYKQLEITYTRAK